MEEQFIVKAKIAAISAGLGLCSLSELELLNRLEKLYFEGFKAGLEVAAQALKIDMSQWRSNSKDSGV